MLRQLELIEAALEAGEEKAAFEELDRGAAMFVELGFDLPLDRLEGALRRLEQVEPENPWVLFYLTWLWSTRRRHTLALVTLRRAAQQFSARWPADSGQGRRARFLCKMAEGVILEREGVFHEARPAFEEALRWMDPPSLQRDLSADEERWVAHDQSGMFAFWLQALHLYQQSGLTFSAARACHNLGTRLMDRGEPLPSRHFLERAYELKLGGSNPISLANTLNSLGHTERHLGLFDQAARHLDEAVDLSLAAENDTTRSYALNNLAEVRRGQRRFEEALALYDSSIELKLRAENVFGHAFSLASRADLHLFAGNATAAVADADEAVRLRVPAADPVENARLLASLARCHLAAGEPSPRVADSLLQAIESFTAFDIKGELVIARWWLAAARLAIELHHEAHEDVTGALQMVARYRLEHLLAPHAALHPELLELGMAEPELAETAENLSSLTRRVDTQLAATMRPLRLRARLFGDLEVTLGGEPVPLWAWRSKKAVSLLALLLHHRGDPVHREQAIEALWPEGDPDRGSKNLNVALTATRRGLEQIHPQGSRCVRRQGSFYRLAPEVIDWLDAGEFSDLAGQAQAHAAAGQLEAAAGLAQRALNLAQEDYLASEPYAAWAARERARLSEVAADLATRLAEWSLELESVDQAITQAKAAIGRQPLSERAWLTLMRSYLARGDRVAALNAFEECASLFSAEIGIEPSAELRQLAAFLRR